MRRPRLAVQPVPPGRHRERMHEASAKARYKRRQHIGETPFAALKGLFGLRRFLLRGIEGVQTDPSRVTATPTTH